MTLIPLDRIDPHPDNPNRMDDATLAKLERLVGASGTCPPLIVRPHPTDADRYQLLDGHHRCLVLRRLGHDVARCEVWTVDDADADLLLVTLNRLHGRDDPAQRGRVLARLADARGLAILVDRLPETAARLQRLIDLAAAPPTPAPPPKADDLPQAITFFLRAPVLRRLRRRLRAIDPDPSRALVRCLDLDERAVEAA